MKRIRDIENAHIPLNTQSRMLSGLWGLPIFPSTLRGEGEGGGDPVGRLHPPLNPLPSKGGDYIGIFVFFKSLCILLGLVLFFSSCSKKPVYPEAPFDGTSIRIALAAIPEKIPLFFTFTVNTQKINFFLLRRNGNVESYFDACGKCYPQKLGFRTEHEQIVCRACDVSYRLDDLKEGIGSCYPIKLKGRIEGNTFIIEKEEVLKGEKFF